MRKINLAGLLVVTLLAAAVFALGNPSKTNAQDASGGYRITPLRTELEIERGQSETIEIEAQNVSENEALTGISILDFVPNPDESGAAKVIVDREAFGDNQFSLIDWVELPAPELATRSEPAKLQVTVTVPEDAAPGSYFGVLQVRPATNDELDGADGGAVGLNATVGSLLLVTVPGDTVELLSLEEIGGFDGDSIGNFFSSPPEAIAVRVRNEGNVFSKPFGNVIVTDWRGNVVKEYELNSSTPPGNVLPASVRLFTEDIEDLNSIGRYTATVNVSYGDGSSVITAENTFWIVPWVPIVVVVALLIVGLFVATRGLKAYNRRVLDKSRGK